MKKLVHQWFSAWESGDFESIPVSDAFQHTSPYGTVDGKKAYLDLVRANTDKFLDNEFVIHDGLYGDQQACVRYTVRKGDFSMEVSEWFFANGSQLERIISYYNIEGEISDERTLEKMPENP